MVTIPNAPDPNAVPSDQPQLTVPTQQPTQPAQPAQPAQQPQAQPAPAATAPAAALAPSRTSQVHGVLGGIMLGALAGAAQKLARPAATVGRGLKQRLANFAANSPRGQELQANALARQKAQQEMQQAQVKAMDEHTEAQVRTNGMSLDNAHKVVENSHLESLYPMQEEAERNTLLDQHRAQNAADRDFASTLESIGVHVDTSHGPLHTNLTQDHAQAVATGKQTMLNNGETGADAGYGFVNNQELQNTVLPSDVKVITDWDIDSKTGAMTPKYSTLKAGQNTTWDALIAHDSGMKKFNNLQGIYTQQLATEKAKGEVAAQAADVAEKRSAAALNDAYVHQMGGGAGGPGGAGNTPLPAVAQAVAALPPETQRDLQQYSPAIQGLLIRGAHGWIDPATFPPRLTKGGLGITRAQATAVMNEINPNYSDNLYNTIKKTQADYVTGKEGQSIRSFNQFLAHSQELKHVSEGFQRTNSPWLNTPLNEIEAKGMGSPGVPEMMTAVEAARQEWTTFINSGYSPDEQMNKRADILMSDKSTPSQIMGVLGVMGAQAIGRLDQLNESYKTATGQDYPNLVTPSGRAAAQELGINTSQYQSGGTYAGGAGRTGAVTGGAPKTPPAGATHQAPGSDGKMHYTNAQGQDLGLVQ